MVRALLGGSLIGPGHEQRDLVRDKSEDLEVLLVAGLERLGIRERFEALKVFLALGKVFGLGKNEKGGNKGGVR